MVSNLLLHVWAIIVLILYAIMMACVCFFVMTFIAFVSLYIMARHRISRK